MADNCVRSISFTIPGKHNKPAVEVRVVENADGTLTFTVDVLETELTKQGDLRGFYFDMDEFVLPGLHFVATDPIITNTQIGNDDVINVGPGANMHGAVADGGFDVGLRFGTPGKGKDDVDEPVSFTLGSTGGLTLDDIAHMEFGARLTSTGDKITTIAPAAPDAVADDFDIFEDGASGLDDPSTVPAGVEFDVLANDTDADGDTLDITEVHSAQHGSVQIIQGVGGDPDTVLYTPDEDYSGEDSFEYCITDNNGGTDFTTVTISIAAVADIPDVTYKILAGATVHEIIVEVTATQTDADSSEFIDRIELGPLPAGVTAVPLSVDPGAEPDELTQQFVITLPDGEDKSFDLVISAASKEVSNGDEQTGVVSIPIEIDFTANDFTQTFLATEQSIWETGDQFTFTDDRFLGINESFDEGFNDFVFGSVEGSLKAGFQSTLTFEGGEINASLTYDIGIDTTFNKTTDTLLIELSKALTDGGFTTEGPEGSYLLDFIFNYFFDLKAGLDFGALGTVDLVDIDIGPSNNTINLIDANSDDLLIEIPLPFGLSATVQWPDIETSSAGDTTDPFSASGQSSNFLELDLDVDEALADIFLGGANPFDIDFDIDIAVGQASGSVELLDFDILGDFSFLQQFVMDELDLTGTLHFEDGTDLAFIFGDDITLQNASAIDVAGNNNGVVDFTLELTPDADLTNDTDLGIDVDFSFELLKASGSYDLFGLGDSFVFGPVVDIDGDLVATTVDIYSETFALNFAPQDLHFGA